MSAGNDDLHGLFERLSKQLTDIKTTLIEIRDEKLEKILEVLRSGFEDVQDAVNRNIQAQAEIKMVEYMMEVEEVEPQIEAERTRLREEQADLEERLDQIDQRYQKRHQDLDEKAAERIRDLGEHIFALEEEQFEPGVEEPFVEHVSPSWGALRADNAVAMTDRQQRVEDTVERTVTEVNEFIERQDALVDKVANYRSASAQLAPDGETPAEIQVPYYVVEYETNNKTHRELVGPAEVVETPGDDRWVSVELNSLAGVDELLGTDRAGPDVHQARSGMDAERRSLDGARVASRLHSHGRSSRGLSYVDAFEAAVGERLEYRVEGGD